MAKQIPTRAGDVLIVRTTKSYSIHAIGRVSKDGQQDFSNEADTEYETDYTAAVARAKALVLRGGRVFFKNIDTGAWNEIQ